jgi:histidinol dehydrogenase
MTFQIANWQDADFLTKIGQIIQNNAKIDQKTSQIVAKIIDQVQKNGDEAIVDLCNKFDGTNFTKPSDLLVSQQEIDQASKNIDQGVKNALEKSLKRVISYHEKQLPQDFSYQDDSGNNLGNTWQAISKVGIYVPGGTAQYPSSVIMNAGPAIVAGCDEIIMTTPSSGGKICDSVLVAAQICGIKKI